jgi:hypothetical protein
VFIVPEGQIPVLTLLVELKLFGGPEPIGAQVWQAASEHADPEQVVGGGTQAPKTVTVVCPTVPLFTQHWLYVSRVTLILPELQRSVVTDCVEAVLVRGEQLQAPPQPTLG